MKIEENPGLEITYILGGIVSFVATATLLIAHAFVPRLWKPPGVLMFGWLAGQLIIDGHMLYSLVIYWLYDSLENDSN